MIRLINKKNYNHCFPPSQTSFSHFNKTLFSTSYPFSSILNHPLLFPTHLKDREFEIVHFIFLFYQIFLLFHHPLHLHQPPLQTITSLLCFPVWCVCLGLEIVMVHVRSLNTHRNNQLIT